MSEAFYKTMWTTLWKMWHSYLFTLCFFYWTWRTQTSWLYFENNWNQKSIATRVKGIKKSIYPEYQKIASYITIQRNDINKNSEKLITTINKHGENLHREIDTIMQKLKSDIDETDSINLALLKEQEDEITRTISVITQIIA